MYDNVEQRHTQEVAAAEQQATARYNALYPVLDPVRALARTRPMPPVPRHNPPAPAIIDTRMAPPILVAGAPRYAQLNFPPEPPGFARYRAHHQARNERDEVAPTVPPTFTVQVHAPPHPHPTRNDEQREAEDYRVDNALHHGFLYIHTHISRGFAYASYISSCVFHALLVTLHTLFVVSAIAVAASASAAGFFLCLLEGISIFCSVLGAFFKVMMGVAVLMEVVDLSAFPESSVGIMPGQLERGQAEESDVHMQLSLVN